MYPLTSTNHREELMITLYSYSSRLSIIIILDWHWANSGGVGVEPRRGLSWFHSNELMPPPGPNKAPLKTVRGVYNKCWRLWLISSNLMAVCNGFLLSWELKNTLLCSSEEHYVLLNNLLQQFIDRTSLFVDAITEGGSFFGLFLIRVVCQNKNCH